MDVHAKSTVWCLVDAQGAVTDEGRIPTTAPTLTTLVRELGHEDELLTGQEIGTFTYLVHDAVTAAGTTLLSFNAQGGMRISRSPPARRLHRAAGGRDTEALPRSRLMARLHGGGS